MNTARELTFDVKGMTCEHCERTVARALQTAAGVEKVLEVSHTGAFARVAAAPDADAAVITSAVVKAGYEARVRGEGHAPHTPAIVARSGEQFDLAIEGGGSAGFAAAIKAADLGARVALV